jgi:4-hydroxybenzoate polyprenyltransferase
MQKLMNFFDSLDFSPITIIITVGILTVMRLFLESFSSPEATGMFAPMVGVLSYATLYGMLIIMLGTVVTILTRKSFMWSVRIITLVFPIILLTPIIDLALSHGAGFCIGYAQDGGASLIKLFINFLGSHKELCGITPGLRFQIVAVVLGVGGIVFTATKSWWRTLLGIISAYCIAFFGGSLPVIVSVIANTGSSFFADATRSLLGTIHYPTESIYFIPTPTTMTTALLARIQMVGLVAGMALMWFFDHRTNWRQWWAGFYHKLPIAVIHFMLLGLGLTLGWSITGTHLLWPDWFAVIMIFFAIVFAASSMGAMNDLHDVAIDKVSNKKWWLIDQHMPPSELKTIQYITGFLALACAFLVNYNAVFCIAVFMAAYSVYSSGIHLKRFWVTSTFFIILAGCGSFLAGFFTLSADQVVGNMPLSILAMIACMLIPYSLIKDIPDIEGDRGHSLTFPVLFGVPATLIGALLVSITWLAVFWSIIPWFLSLGVIMTIIFLLAKRSLAREKKWLLGLPVCIWIVGLLLHIIFVL